MRVVAVTKEEPCILNHSTLILYYFAAFCLGMFGLFHFAVQCLILMSCFEAAINHTNSKEISLPLFHKMEGCWLERLDDGQSAAITIPVRVWNPFRFLSVAPSLLYSLFHSFQELELCTQEDSLTARHRDPVQTKNTSTKIINGPHRNAHPHGHKLPKAQTHVVAVFQILCDAILV